jgi:RNA recognition motif-containing protein
MTTKLYVGGIPYSSTEAGLTDAFSKAGSVVSAAIIIDRPTGRSKGFGFVEMASEEDAQKAIEMYDGADFEGRKLTVNVARPLEPRNNDRRGM